MGPLAPGNGQTNEYHGGKSLSLIFDLGGGWKPTGTTATLGHRYLFSKKAKLSDYLKMKLEEKTEVKK